MKLLTFLAMWQVMIVAMMLLSSAPVLKLFARVSSAQPQAIFIFI
jgi:predicted metal-binding membrane protein